MYAPVLEKVALNIDAAALTIRGQQRTLNEDSVFRHTYQADTGHEVGLCLVCDGVGGHEAGDVASQMTVQVILAKLGPVISTYQHAVASGRALPTYFDDIDLLDVIKEAVTEANSRVRDYIKEKLPPGSKAGTTLTMAFIFERTALIANVGDSRTYGWRDGQLTQITQDHSLVAELVANGAIEPEDRRQHPWRNVIFRAIGGGDQVDVNIFTWDIRPGDKLLLCSDGLWQAFPDSDELAARLGTETEIDDICWQLVGEANQRDGSDNISAVVVSIEESPMPGLMGDKQA